MRKFLKKANFNFSLQSCTHHFLHREANRRQNANGWIFRAFLYIYIYNLFDLQRRGSFSQTTKSCWRCHFTASDQRLCSLLILTSCFLKLRAKANKAEISTQLCITTTNPHSPATRPPHPNHLLSPHFHIFIQVRPPCRRPHASSYLSRCEDAGDIWNNGCGLMKMTRGTLSVQNEGWGVFFFFLSSLSFVLFLVFFSILWPFFSTSPPQLFSKPCISEKMRSRSHFNAGALNPHSFCLR